MNEILLEYYAGKSKELIKCEGYLKEIITLIKKDHEDVLNPSRRRSVYRDAEPCKKLEVELANFFNVDEVNIYWSERTRNAYTVTGNGITSMNRKNKYLNGDKQPLRLHIVVYEDLVYHADLNERELMGLILHEIGHNFYYSPFIVINEILAIVTFPPNILLGPLFKNLYKLKDNVGNVIKKEAPFLWNICAIINNLLSESKQIFKGYHVLTAIVSRLNNVSNPVGLFVNSLGGYGNERGADSFAAKYGYGPDQASALYKIEHPKNMLGQQAHDAMGPLGTVMDDLCSLGLDLFILMTMDPHPNTNQRCSSMLKKLKRDLTQGDYPPAMKKDLQAEIDRMEKQYKCINDANNGDHTIEIKKAWYNIIDTMTDGHSDIREIFNKFYENHEF